MFFFKEEKLFFDFGYDMEQLLNKITVYFSKHTLIVSTKDASFPWKLKLVKTNPKEKKKPAKNSSFSASFLEIQKTSYIRLCEQYYRGEISISII